MARKGNESLAEAPPPAASSSEESDSDSGDNESSSSDDEVAIQTPQTQQTQPSNNKSDTDTDSGTDSDADSNSDSKPAPSDHTPSKPASLTTPIKRKNNDDAEPSNNGVSPKKAKKDKIEESGKKASQRLWSGEDEILLLKGLVEFKARIGKYPMNDVDGFVDFIKDSLHVSDVKKEQIVSKVRRLKGRYQAAKKRNLTDAHDMETFELSKSIWGESDEGGDETGNNKKMKASNGKSKGAKNADDDEGIQVVKSNFKFGCVNLEELNKFGNVDEDFMKEALMLVDDDERKALEEDWFKCNVAEMENVVKRFELYHKTTKSLLNALD